MIYVNRHEGNGVVLRKKGNVEKGTVTSSATRSAKAFMTSLRVLSILEGCMSILRILLSILAVIHALFAGFTALVGAFANGGGIWERLILMLLHPLGAAGVLLLVLAPRLPRFATIAISALLLMVVIADLALAQRIASGAVKGDWELAVIFSVVPIISIAYAMIRLRTGGATGE